MPKPTEEESLRRIVTQLSLTGKWQDYYLPCDYLVLDVETTGFSSVKNRIVSVGFCAVKDCAIVNDIHSGQSANVVIKWPEEVFDGCQSAIDIHGIDYNRSQREGVEPVEAMMMLNDAIKWARAENMFIVGHNLLKFDMPFLGMELNRAGIKNNIVAEEVVDTHALCKAMQLGMIPGANESSFDYFTRVTSFRAKGVFSNLEKYCIDRFDLRSRYGVDSTEAHDSGYDCWLTHLVMQGLNEMLGLQSSSLAAVEAPW